MLTIHVAQKGASRFILGKQLRTAKKDFEKLFGVSVNITFTPSMGRPMAEATIGASEFIVGKDKDQLRMAHNNLEKLCRDHIREYLPKRAWTIPPQTKEAMSERGVDLKCTLDFYPFPHSFAEPLPDTQRIESKVKIAGRKRVSSKKKKKKAMKNSEGKNASVATFSVCTDSTAFDDWRHLQDSLGTALPVLQRENGGLQQTVMFWRDIHSCARNPGRMRQLLDAFRPDTFVLELTPNAYDSILSSRYCYARMKQAAIEGFTEHYVERRLNRLETAKQMQDVEIKWYNRHSGGFLHLDKMLRYCERRPTTTTIVAADWSSSLQLGMQVFRKLLDACHLLDDGSYQSAIEQTEHKLVMEYDATIAAPHSEVSAAYRNDYNVLPILEMMPTPDSRHERVLAVYGVDHVCEMVDRLTGQRPINKLVECTKETVRFTLPKAYNYNFLPLS